MSGSMIAAAALANSRIINTTAAGMAIVALAKSCRIAWGGFMIVRYGGCVEVSISAVVRARESEA